VFLHGRPPSGVASVAVDHVPWVFGNLATQLQPGFVLRPPHLDQVCPSVKLPQAVSDAVTQTTGRIRAETSLHRLLPLYAPASDSYSISSIQLS
jgi:hypothetical protein